MFDKYLSQYLNYQIYALSFTLKLEEDLTYLNTKMEIFKYILSIWKCIKFKNLNSFGIVITVYSWLNFFFCKKLKRKIFHLLNVSSSFIRKYVYSVDYTAYII